MDLYLQVGAGMKRLSNQLVNEWGGGTAILSPFSLDDGKLASFAAEFRANGGKVWVDPQFYLPYSKHSKLKRHAYWPSDYSSGTFWSDSSLQYLLYQVIELNRRLACDAIILPGLFADPIDTDWLERQTATVREALRLTSGAIPCYATIALSAASLANQQAIADLLDEAENWQIQGCYILCERPGRKFFVRDTRWLAGLLDLVAGLRLDGKQVVVGYSQPQMLVVGCAAATAIASGVHVSLRNFNTERFEQSEVDESAPFDNSVWYYAPRTLCEFHREAVFTASKAGVLDALDTPAEYGETPARAMLDTPEVTAVALTFGRTQSQQHYLQCLRYQAMNVCKPTLRSTLAWCDGVLDEADDKLNVLLDNRIRPRSRVELSGMLQASRESLTILEQTRGPILARRWTEL